MRDAESGGADLLVMAAGMGSRFGGLKQLSGPGPAGETLLEYGLYDAARAGFGRFVFVIRRDLEADFQRLILSRLPPRLEVELAFQDPGDLPRGSAAVGRGRTKPWGTAHAVWAARRVMDRPFVVMNADDFYGRGAFALLGALLAGADPAEGDWFLAGYRLADTLSSHGEVARALVAVDPAGRLIGLRENPRIELSPEGPRALGVEGGALPLDPGAIVSMNLFGLTPAVFPMLEDSLRSFLAGSGGDSRAECYLPAALDQAVAAGRAGVRVLATGEAWFGLTWPEDFEAARERLAAPVAAGVYPSPLWSS